MRCRLELCFSGLLEWHKPATPVFAYPRRHAPDECGLNWVYGHLGIEPMGVEGVAWASTISTFVGTKVYFGWGIRFARVQGFFVRLADGLTMRR